MAVLRVFRMGPRAYGAAGPLARLPSAQPPHLQRIAERRGARLASRFTREQTEAVRRVLDGGRHDGLQRQGAVLLVQLGQTGERTGRFEAGADSVRWAFGDEAQSERAEPGVFYRPPLSSPLDAAASDYKDALLSHPATTAFHRIAERETWVLDHVELNIE